MKAEYIYKTKIPYAFIVFMTLGTAFWGFILYLMYPMKPAPGQDIDDETALWIARGFELIIVFLALCCFYGVIGFKLSYLTSDELVIHRPLLMYRRRVDLIEIDKIMEKKENVNLSHGFFDESRIYSGNKATILLTTGRKIRISSIQIRGYKELIDKIRTQIIRAWRQMR
nr:hypothetical protein [uncultured Mucilaginibacter sp.]